MPLLPTTASQSAVKSLKDELAKLKDAIAKAAASGTPVSEKGAWSCCLSNAYAAACPSPTPLPVFPPSVKKQQAAQLRRLKSKIHQAKIKAQESKLRQKIADAVQALLLAPPADKQKAQDKLAALQANLKKLNKAKLAGARGRNAIRTVTRAIKSANATSKRLAAKLAKLDVASAKVDALLAAGKITQAQADARKAKINASKTGLQKALTKANVRPSGARPRGWSMLTRDPHAAPLAAVQLKLEHLKDTAATAKAARATVKATRALKKATKLAARLEAKAKALEGPINNAKTAVALALNDADRKAAQEVRACEGTCSPAGTPRPPRPALLSRNSTIWRPRRLASRPRLPLSSRRLKCTSSSSSWLMLSASTRCV